MNRRLQIFTNGFIKENPLLVLNIGLCSSLGVTTSVFNGLGMGVGMTFVLLMSEIVISIFRKLIPQAIRLPVFIIIIAAFTTIVQLVLQAYVPSLYEALGVFLPLIVVNCIIMGRVEAFASKNKTSDSILDALGMGIGYTMVLVLISLIREVLGGGTIFSGTAMKIVILPESYRIGMFNSAPGGFLVFGLLAALVQGTKQAQAAKIEAKEKALRDEKKALKKAEMEKIEAQMKAEAEAKKKALLEAALAKKNASEVSNKKEE